ncbi:unnamed protein product [Ectocarpus sp. 4 AP-2014]
MTMSGRTRSCLSAVIMLLAAAMQTEAFVAGPVMAGRRTMVSMSSLNEEASSAQPARSSRWGSSSSRPIGDGFELSVAEKSFTEMLREKKAKGSFFAPSSEAAANADEVAASAAAEAAEAAAASAAAVEAAHQANLERQKLAFDDEAKPFVAPGSVSTPSASTPGSVTPPGGVSNPAAVSSPKVTDPASVGRPSAPAAPPAAPVSSPAAPRVTDPASIGRPAAPAPPAPAAAPVSTPAAPRVTDPATLAAKAAAPVAPPAAPVSTPAPAAPAAGAGKKWEPRPDWKSSAGSAAPSRPAVSSPSRPAVSRPVSGGPAKATFNPKADAPWKASGGGAPAAPAYAPPAAATPAYAPPAAAAPANSPPAAAPKAAGEKHIGTGGMADTRDPDALNHEDPRKSISAAPSFAEYLKSKQN